MLEADKLKEILAAAGLAKLDRLERFEYFSNPCPPRRIYAVPNDLVVKVYGPSEHDTWRIESHLLPLLKMEGVAAPVMLYAEDFGETGSIIAMEWVTGKILNDVYQELSADEYAKLLFALDREIGNLHRINANRVDVSLFIEEGSSNVNVPSTSLLT